jgi:hypothetical protein
LFSINDPSILRNIVFIQFICIVAYGLFQDNLIGTYHGRCCLPSISQISLHTINAMCWDSEYDRLTYAKLDANGFFIVIIIIWSWKKLGWEHCILDVILIHVHVWCRTCWHLKSDQRLWFWVMIWVCTAFCCFCLWFAC